MGPIGYSPLPINLVEASFAQTNKLQTADKAVQLSNENVTTCHNPTFVAGHPDENHLAQIAPLPPACDKSTAGPCTDSTGVGSTSNPNKNGKVPTSSPTPGAPATGSTPTPGVTPSTGSGGGGQSPGVVIPGSSPGASTETVVPGASAPSVAGSSGTGTTELVGSPTSLSGSNNGGVGSLLVVLAAIELLLVLAIPPFVARRIQRNKASQ
jgi:hypothetical protein